EASRAIDGNTSGSYSSGTQTHTSENTREPWWEVDLRDEVPIESIRIHNRTDADLGQRLRGYTLLVLDERRSEVYRSERNRTPDPAAESELGGSGPTGLVRRAAIEALPHVRGEEARTFRSLARLVREDIERSAAVRALSRIPREHWPEEEVRPLLDAILAWVEKVPARERTSTAVLDALQVGEGLAAKLPGDEGRTARARLGELGVRVIRIGTVPHQMLFDKDRIVVEAGKAVEIVFTNDDIMPHNLVAPRPAALEEVGRAADSTASGP